jgi:hypothetical protein
VGKRGQEQAKLTDRWGNRDPWREEAHRHRARAQLEAVFTHSNTIGVKETALIKPFTGILPCILLGENKDKNSPSPPAQQWSGHLLWIIWIINEKR